MQTVAQMVDPRKAEEDRVLQQCGQDLQNNRQHEVAVKSCQKALATFRQMNDRRGEGLALNNLGVAYNSLGDYKQAIVYHEQSLAIARELKDRLGEGQSLGNLGRAHYDLGNYVKAIEFHRQSLAIARELKDHQR